MTDANRYRMAVHQQAGESFTVVVDVQVTTGGHWRKLIEASGPSIYEALVNLGEMAKEQQAFLDELVAEASVECLPLRVVGSEPGPVGGDPNPSGA